MEDKVLSFRNSDLAEAYCSVADRRAAEGDLVGELSVFFSALKNCKEQDSAEMLANIADCYSRMELYELSNQYWFYCLDKKYLSGDLSEAYGELSANFYCTDDIWTSAYYLKQKADINPEDVYTVDPETVKNMFREISEGVATYNIVYPYDHADYSERKKQARRAFSSNAYGIAAACYSSIPEECRDENEDGELAMAYFFSKEDDKAIAACKNSIKKSGENLTACCNLSTIYGEIGEDDKSAYYYAKALSLKKGAKDEDFKLASCAVERGDHLTARNCLASTLKERPYDITLRFFYALSMLNLGENEKGFEQLSECYKLNPEDYIIGWYSEQAKKLVAGEKTGVKLPFRYEKDLPEKVIRRYEKIFCAYLDGRKTGVTVKEMLGIARVCVYCSDELVARRALYIIAHYDKKDASLAFLKRTLLDCAIGQSLKTLAVHLLIDLGCKDRVGVLTGRFYMSLKLRRLPFEKDDPVGDTFIQAYGYAVSYLIFFGVEDTDKMLFKLNRIYTERKQIFSRNEIRPDELAAAAVFESGYKELSKLPSVGKLFGIKTKRLSAVIEMLKGGNND